MLLSSARDKFSPAEYFPIRFKATVYGVFGVYGRFQSGLVVRRMQQICNTYATTVRQNYVIRRDVFHKTKDISFLFYLYFVNGIDKHLDVQMGVHFFGHRHCTGVSDNLLDDSLINLSLRQH